MSTPNNLPNLDLVAHPVVQAAPDRTATPIAGKADDFSARLQRAGRDADANCRRAIAREPLKAIMVAAAVGAALTMVALGLVRRSSRLR